VLVAITSGAASARTIAVPGDSPTIGGAMAAASAGDIILVSCGVYNESDIQVTSGVSLWSGTLQPDCVVIDAGDRGRVLVFADCDSNTTVVGFTLRGGVSEGDGGAVLCRDAAPRISRCVIRDSRARRGGGLAVRGLRAPRLEDCVISGNEADLHGGGVFWDSDAFGRLLRCTIEINRGLAGGGLACLRGDDLRVTESVILANQAAASGGGLWVGGGAPRLRDCVIARNHGGIGGGALACREGRPRLLGCTLVDNEVEAVAGGVLVRAGEPRLERSIVAFNGAEAAAVMDGGALALAACNVFGHADGNWPEAIAGQADRDGNFSLDPRFCSRRSGLYDLSARSPCLPGNRDGGALVGARGRGCD
jgi:hypothetical protein